jgi:hypothetical protein
MYLIKWCLIKHRDNLTYQILDTYEGWLSQKVLEGTADQIMLEEV